MKTCELCKSAAKIYCYSDEASLCWTCDNKVHSANFLVARHSRTLLCRKCQSTTPWTASGEKLGPSTVSICEKCVVDATAYKEEEDDDEYEVDEDSEDEIDVDDEEEDNDNQVVPLSFTPPPPASSSSCCDYSGGGDSVLLKRKRENVPDLSSEDDCLSVQRNQRVVSVESSEAIEGNRLYHFLPLSSEAMGENKNKTGSDVKEQGLW